MRELLLILQTAANAYISLYITRLWAGWMRADFRNPLLISIVSYTNPLLRPARRLLPPVGRWDVALMAIILGLEWVLQCITSLVSFGIFPLNFKLLLAALLEAIDLGLSLGLLFCLGYSLLSWLAPDDPYLPASRFFQDMLGGLLRPLRRWLPATPGIDFSPMVLMLLFWILRVIFNSHLYPLLWGVS